MTKNQGTGVVELWPLPVNSFFYVTFLKFNIKNVFIASYKNIF